MSVIFNMSRRKFRKQMGVTSQPVKETALKDAADGNKQSHKAEVNMTVKGLELEQIVIGTMKG